MRVLGIDPGLTGGAAILITGGDLDGEARLWGAIDIPVMGVGSGRRLDAESFGRWLRSGAPDIAFIERAQAMPSQGRSACFNYGCAVGALQCAVVLCGVGLHIIEAGAWKRRFSLPGKAWLMRERGMKEHEATRAAKEASRQLVLRMMPTASPFLARMRDHGRAEAALIAMHGADLIEEGLDWNADRRTTLGPTSAQRALPLS